MEVQTSWFYLRKSKYNHPTYEILLRIKIFRHPQISDVHIVDSSSCVDRKKELQLQHWWNSNWKTDCFLVCTGQNQCFWHKCTHTGWIGFVRFPHEDIQSFHFMKGLTKTTTLLHVHVSLRDHNVMLYNLIYAFFSHNFLNISLIDREVFTC